MIAERANHSESEPLTPLWIVEKRRAELLGPRESGGRGKTLPRTEEFVAARKCVSAASYN